jgi:hypothetical protein
MSLLNMVQRGGAAIEVAAGILPAVEPGFQPGGRNTPNAANQREFTSTCPSTPRFRAARCRPLRQPGWLPLRNPRDPRRLGQILISDAAVEWLVTPHPDPLPQGEGTACEASCCSTPVRHTSRSGIPKDCGRFSLSLGERAGMRGTEFNLPLGLIRPL